MDKIPACYAVTEVNALVGIKPEHGFPSRGRCILQHVSLRTARESKTIRLSSAEIFKDDPSFLREPFQLTSQLEKF
jgi:hypothetical protein